MRLVHEVVRQLCGVDQRAVVVCCPEGLDSPGALEIAPPAEAELQQRARAYWRRLSFRSVLGTD